MGETDKPESVGAMMARLRWAKATRAERAEVGRMLVAARAAKRRKQGTKGSQGRPRIASKS